MSQPGLYRKPGGLLEAEIAFVPKSNHRPWDFLGFV
jgi:hypothetical protein